ncbi:MAG TPA: ABC transporter permease [Terracidiphilus sp.]|nr:ABC transporter permease [Terracidiphilus sp.]
MNSLLQDFSFALRQLRKAPGFAITVVVTLALGIGANAAIFTLFDQVLLRMLPVRNPKELVRFRWSGSFQGSESSFGGDSFDYFSYPMYKDLRDQNQFFQGILAADKCYVGVSWRNQAENEDAEVVSGNYFQLLGLRPALGRLFTREDETAKNANPVVVLSYGYWRSRFAGDRNIVGQDVLINGHPFTIVGVAPQNFDSAIGGYRPRVFVPITMVGIAIPWRVPLDDLNDHRSAWLTLVARLKPAVTISQAQAGLDPLWRALRATELTAFKSTTERFRRNFVENSHIQVLDDSRGFLPGRTDLQKPLYILMGMAGLLIVLCSINVATLLLLRAASRAREMSMRYALGAKRGRIISQLLVEGGMLGLAGAGAGLALAPVAATLLVRLIASADPGNEPYSTSIDARILLFSFAVSFLATVAFSFAPVFHFLRPDLAGSLRVSAGTATRASQRFRKAAVGAQIALSVLLLGAAGLFVRTLDNLLHAPVGYDTTHLLTFNLDPTSSGYGEDRTMQIVMESLESLRRIPGVVVAAASTDPELSGDTSSSNFSIQGYKPAEDENMDFEQSEITPDYFATLRQPILAGREFTEADTKGRPKVAVVNLALAKRFYGSPQNAIGRQMAFGNGNGANFDITIVGVTGDIRHTDLRTPLGPAVYQPYLQVEHPRSVAVYLQTTRPPQLFSASVRNAMHQLDPTLVVDGLRTMEAQIDRTANDERALAFLAVGFSAFAMILAAVGLYGVLAYSTEQRTREIGVRIALGSPRLAVVLLVFREMVWIAAIATGIALPCTVAVARLFQSQLYGVATFDPLTLLGAAFFTASMVGLASALPARRAASIEPMQALRTE